MGITSKRSWGEKAYYNRAKGQIEFLGKQKKPYYDGIVSALQYLALYEPEKLILEEYEIARTLFDNCLLYTSDAADE